MKTKTMIITLAAVLSLIGCGTTGTPTPVDRFGNAQMIIQDYQQLIHGNKVAETEFPEFNYNKQVQLSPFFNIPLLNMVDYSRNDTGKQIFPRHSLNLDASFTLAQTEHFRILAMPISGRPRFPN